MKRPKNQHINMEVWKILDKTLRFSHNVGRIPTDQKHAIDRLLTQAGELRDPEEHRRMTDAVMAMIKACGRTAGRRASDQDTDHRRRILVGARVPRETAAAYRAVAEASGRSMYAFVCDALAAEHRRTRAELLQHRG